MFPSFTVLLHHCRIGKKTQMSYICESELHDPENNMRGDFARVYIDREEEKTDDVRARITLDHFTRFITDRVTLCHTGEGVWRHPDLQELEDIFPKVYVVNEDFSQLSSYIPQMKCAGYLDWKGPSRERWPVTLQGNLKQYVDYVCNFNHPKYGIQSIEKDGIEVVGKRDVIQSELDNLIFNPCCNVTRRRVVESARKLAHLYSEIDPEFAARSMFDQLEQYGYVPDEVRVPGTVLGKEVAYIIPRQ